MWSIKGGVRAIISKEQNTIDQMYSISTMRIQKIPSGVVGERTTFSVLFLSHINVFHRGPPSRSNWPQWGQLLLEGGP